MRKEKDVVIMQSAYHKRTETLYYSTFNGRWFKDAGGYTHQFEIKKSKERNENAQTRAIVVGTVLGGIGGD